MGALVILMIFVISVAAGVRAFGLAAA